VRLRTTVLDRLVGAVLAVMLAPVIGLLAWRVRRDDGPPSLVGLDRVGRDGTTFRMWKLRSMRAEQPDGAAAGAVITAGDGDPRITTFGAVLRRWRLDELPQVWNVVRGDMGLLGPRPETPSLVDMGDPRWRAVLAVRPGVTGPTQLVVEQWETEVLAAGSQEDTYRTVVLPVKLAVDEWYVRRGSLLTDLQVVCSMFQRFVIGRSATWVDRTVRTHVPEARDLVDGAR
jgi:lipopolysaccharide/colanic/teichoic acid biosynthesis glycosyltransferase